MSPGKSRSGAQRRFVPGSVLEWGLFAGVAIVPLGMLPTAYNPFGTTKTLLLALAAALVAAGLALESSRLPEVLSGLSRRPGALGLAALPILAVAATAVSIDQSQALTGHYPDYQGLLAMLAYAVVALGAIVAVRDAESRLRFARWLAAAMAVVAAYGLLQAAGVDPVLYRAAGPVASARIRSTLGNSSNLGVWLLLGLPLVAWLALETRERIRWAYGGLAVVSLGLLGLTLSRGAWLGTLVGVAVFAVLSIHRIGDAKARRWTIVVLLGGGAAALIALAATPLARLRIAAMFEPGGTIAWRLEVWRSSLQLLADRPLLGSGPATFRYAFAPHRTAETLAGRPLTETIDDPHNLLVSLGTALGVLAPVALGVAVAYAVIVAFRRRNEADGLWHAALCAGLLGGLAALMAHFLTPDTAPLFWMVLALLVAGPGMARKKREKRQERAVAAPIRSGLVVLAVLYGSLALAAVGAVRADVRVRDALGAATSDVAWETAAAHAEAARRTAPWEPAFDWAAGRVALERLSMGFDTGVYEYGKSALVAAEDGLPLDARLATESGDLVLMAALAQGDAASFEDARSRYERAIALEPENAAPWIGLGTSHAGLGDWASAVETYETAVALAPHVSHAWTNLAIAYERVGDAEAAAAARARAGE